MVSGFSAKRDKSWGQLLVVIPLGTHLEVASGDIGFPGEKGHLQWQLLLKRMLWGLMLLSVSSPDLDTGGCSSRILVVSSSLRLRAGPCMAAPQQQWGQGGSIVQAPVVYHMAGPQCHQTIFLGANSYIHAKPNSFKSFKLTVPSWIQAFILQPLHPGR